MVKLLEVIGRRADLTHEAFVHHQVTRHLDVVSRVPEFVRPVRGYMQNHLLLDADRLATIRGLPVSTDTDSVIEVWYDCFEDIMQAFTLPQYMEIIRPDELSFGDVAGVWGVASLEQHVVFESQRTAGPMKILAFLARKPTLSHDAFRDRWAKANLPLRGVFATQADRLVENWVSQDPMHALPGAKAYDVVLELWFQSLDDIARFAPLPAAQALFGADSLDAQRTVIYIAEEHPESVRWLNRMRQAGLATAPAVA